jgi:hypothetical protein
LNLKSQLKLTLKLKLVKQRAVSVARELVVARITKVEVNLALKNLL